MERTIGPNQNQVFSCTELHVQRFNLSPPQISQKISQRTSPTNISLIGGISFFGEISTVSLSVRYHSACSGKISSTPASPWSKFFARSNCTIAWKIANNNISAFFFSSSRSSLRYHTPLLVHKKSTKQLLHQSKPTSQDVLVDLSWRLPWADSWWCKLSLLYQFCSHLPKTMSQTCHNIQNFRPFKLKDTS